MITHVRILIPKCSPNVAFVTKRTKFKMKPDQKKTPSITNSDRALEHFDLYYKPVFGKLWPSIRISLLTAKKSSVVINNFSQYEEHIHYLLSLGAKDILTKARNRQKNYTTTSKNQISVGNFSGKQEEPENFENRLSDMRKFTEIAPFEKRLSDMRKVTENAPFEKRLSDMRKVTENNPNGNIVETENDFLQNNITLGETDRQNLDVFLPAKTIYSEHTQKRLTEARQSVYTPMDVRVDIVKPPAVALPSNLTVLAFPPGNTGMFPEPKPDVPGGYLCHFMMDGASILPVIALGVQEGDSVLDLCAAPGGKSLVMLQTRLPGHLHCNDRSKGRIERLRSIFRQYVPEADQKTLRTSLRIGQQFQEPIYDKVLVDGPCFTDRHALLEDTHNVFSPMRLNDRLEMPNLQRELLRAGIQSCKPGGAVVYSTCTLSPVQNDGIVQATIDDIWKNTGINLEIDDLSEMKYIFRDTFKFHDGCRFGQLVVPSLSRNFGPMYFSRIRRVS
ncbi:5-methylcytosine rRNA methyltransferase NSUN4-like [Dreissena polymorpha]|uniref:NOL1/NOP2/Sun domain family member 4 n=1 Tax=Dreissena polymorpha TaxID=45954 RepID=A0A9D4CYI2_DREPO|nr:5-methylcytosine rRNA methyltransferase NSUN4-like [Dreissena polymorpha]KAH3734511.1 hypothetical protein DPMN_040950 [Dreissena polymorpha]